VSRKSKKPKTPKAPKGRGGNGGGKDSVTGLYFEVPGTKEVFRSDVTQTIKKGTSALFPDLDTDIIIEFELSKDYMVWTFRDVSDELGISRIVQQGDFRYNSKGALTSATLGQSAQEWPTIPSLGGVINSPRSGPISVDGSTNGFQMLLGMTGEEWATTDSYSSESFTTQDGLDAIQKGNGFWEVGDGKIALRSFGQGKFFYDGWQNNPFASNLI